MATETTEIQNSIPASTFKASKKEIRSIISLLVEKTKLNLTKELDTGKNIYGQNLSDRYASRDPAFLAKKALNSRKYADLKEEIRSKIDQYIACSKSVGSQEHYQLRFTDNVKSPVEYCGWTVKCLTQTLENKVIQAINIEMAAAKEYLKNDLTIRTKLSRLNSKLVDAMVVEYMYKNMAETQQTEYTSIMEELAVLLEVMLNT